MIETLPSGTILHGRYRIERVLGSGGFGHVYLAIDLMTSQQYAVKEYLVTGSSGQEQLQHEAHVLSQLHHPNLPAFQDAFIERGRYYVVLNYIEGQDLTDLLRIVRQRNDVIPIRQMLSWLLAICDAVMFLHSQRPAVIHRDIKPDNIRITSNGTAILVDLGNAKAAADGARTLFFIRHQGTPGYAPPEQYPGGTGTDARSDVYALGGTLYFALTASEPPSVSTRNQALQQGLPDLPTLQEHVANNPPEASPEEIAARQFRLGVTKPSKPAPRHSRHIAQLGQLPPEILNALNQIIQRSMAMKPQHRYQYVADFANDLKNVIVSLPKPPAPQPTYPKDPNSTQPNLAEMYDAIQNAKENPGNLDAGNPSTQPTSRGATLCPRCHTPLAAGTMHCPRCGAALQSGNTTASPYSTPSAASPDQTVVMTQEQVQQAARVIQRPHSPAVQPDRPSPHQNAHRVAQAMPQARSYQQQSIAENNMSRSTSASHAGSGTKSNSKQYIATSNTKMIFFAFIAAIILVIIIALFILH